MLVAVGSYGLIFKWWTLSVWLCLESYELIIRGWHLVLAKLESYELIISGGHLVLAKPWEL